MCWSRVWYSICLYFTNTSLIDCSVGCIYASKPFNSSPIYYQRLFPLHFYYQTSKTTQRFFSYFSCIFTDTIFVSFVFSMLLTIQRFVSFASTMTFDFGSRKCLPTHWLYRWFGHLIAKALKCWVSMYIQVRHTCIYPLSSVSTITEEVSNGVLVIYIY